MFICHASEDKEEVARPIAKKLADMGFKIWYDEFSLKLGDNLRESIDKGLANSEFGLVILSKNFFSKEWPQKELEGLFALEIEGRKVILPIWHELRRAEVAKYSPMLAGKVAANTNEGIDLVVQKILTTINPEADYFITDSGAVEVSPTEIDLASEEWIVHTNFTVKNFSNRPLHNITLKLSFKNPEIEFTNINIQLVQQTNVARLSLNSSTDFDTEMYLIYANDSNNKDCIFLVLNYLGPKEHKTILINNKTPFHNNKPHLIRITVMDFKNKPSRLLRKTNSISIPVELPETVKVKEIAFLSKRK